jgi:hypothetical protein
MKTGLYTIRIRERQAPHCWLEIWDRTGRRPAMQTGAPSRAAKYTYEVAQELAQQWADWLVASGYGSIARLIELCPATGGHACDWRPTIAKGANQ